MTPDELAELATASDARKARQQRQLIRELRAEIRDLQEEVSYEAARADLALAICDPEPPPPIRARGGRRREATAVICASDWHVEEEVDPASVNGLNEYGPEISRRRAQRFFEGAAWLLRWCNAAGPDQEGYSIRDTVLWLGGDLITGKLHQDNWLSPTSPTEAILMVQGYLTAGIDYLVEATGIDQLIVPCSVGNHGRTTRKPMAAGAHRYSYETLLYHSLAQYYRDHPIVSVHVPQGAHTYLELYDRWTIRFTHGDQIRYAGGVGGISIPVNKAVAAWDRARPADLTVFGHYHQLLNGGRWVANGSLVGFNAYGLQIKATPEPPRQAFFLVDRTRGQTFFSPIWCADA